MGVVSSCPSSCSNRLQTSAQAPSQAWWCPGLGAFRAQGGQSSQDSQAGDWREEAAQSKEAEDVPRFPGGLPGNCPCEQACACGTPSRGKQGPGRENDHTSRRLQTLPGPPDRVKSPPDKELLLKKTSTA